MVALLQQKRGPVLLQFTEDFLRDQAGRADDVLHLLVSVATASAGASHVWKRKTHPGGKIGDFHKPVVTDYRFAGPGFATRKLVGWGLPQTPAPRWGDAA